jgi:N-acetylmuramoyl-L-alanine amidase
LKQKSPLFAISYAGVSIFIIAAILILSFWFNSRVKAKYQPLSPTFSESKAPTFVVDAGHGGEDGGAVAIDGTTEKELNLKISESLALLYELNGNKFAMTRETDTLLYDKYNDLECYQGKKKIYDLKNRVKITKEYQNSVYVGIHMNSFSSSKYSELQVYYSKNNESSKALANTVQSNTSAYLQNNNTRRTKEADSSIFILNNLDCPAVLIECGFISNEAELTLLKSEKYRQKLYTVIFASSLSACIDKAP